MDLHWHTVRFAGDHLAKGWNLPLDLSVWFDPTSFANIAQYRIQFPQVVLLRKSLCGAFSKMEKEIKAEKKARQEANQVIPRQTCGADASLPGLSPAGQIVDLAQKVLTMMQTKTTITGASVNVTDEALVSEVAANLHKLDAKLTVYYPSTPANFCSQTSEKVTSTPQ